MLDTKKTLAKNLSALLDSRPDISRLNLSKQIHVADGTLGRIKYGTGNPTIDVLEQIADFFKIKPWQLLCEDLGRGMLEAREPDRTEAPPGPSSQQLYGAAARNVRLSQEGRGLSDETSQAIREAVQEAIRQERARWDSERRKAG